MIKGTFIMVERRLPKESNITINQDQWGIKDCFSVVPIFFFNHQTLVPNKTKKLQMCPLGSYKYLKRGKFVSCQEPTTKFTHLCLYNVIFCGFKVGL